MPVAFQKTTNYMLIGQKNDHWFLSDLLIDRRGSNADHIKLVYRCTNKLDKDNLFIYLPQFDLAETEIELFVYELCQFFLKPETNKSISNYKSILNFYAAKEFFGYLVILKPSLAQLYHLYILPHD